MRAFGEAKTLKRISRVKNTLNPFAYNGPGDDCYKSLCCNVFRRTVAQLTVGQYNDMLSNGLFDPSHTIGQPYTKQYQLKPGREGQHCWVRVYFRDAPLRAYTTIRAQLHHCLVGLMVLR
ncbi:hypothetical protein HGRIS_001408 [Hohenbuehelia grisea]|uniref:Uncharacterized protein n=1 Tax=Hohenbuehelia grisea TaxID=104357 RepID=A0ABR3JRE4_9AGAR